MNIKEMLDALNHANEKITFTVSLFNVVTILLSGLNCFYVTGERAVYSSCLCVALVCCQSSHKAPGTLRFSGFTSLYTTAKLK